MDGISNQQPTLSPNSTTQMSYDEAEFRTSPLSSVGTYGGFGRSSPKTATHHPLGSTHSPVLIISRNYLTPSDSPPSRATITLMKSLTSGATSDEERPLIRHLSLPPLPSPDIPHTRNRTRPAEALPLILVPPWISPTQYSSFNYLRGTTSALWHPPMLLLVGIVGAHPDPCRSSGSLGSLVLIRILAVHPDPWYSSGSLVLIRILGTHPDPRRSSGSLGSLVLIRTLAVHPDPWGPRCSSGFLGSLLPTWILAVHPDPWDPWYSSGSSPLTRILAAHPDPPRSPRSLSRSLLPTWTLIGILASEYHHPPGSSRSTWTLILTGVLVGSQTFWTPLRSPALL